MKREDSNDTQELHVYVHGRVQGVGFRDFVVRKALSLGLRGYVRNAGDGSVEVLAQGSRRALESLLSLLWQGPSAAHVSEVISAWKQPAEHISRFHVRW